MLLCYMRKRSSLKLISFLFDNYTLHLKYNKFANVTLLYEQNELFKAHRFLFDNYISVCWGFANIHINNF